MDLDASRKLLEILIENSTRILGARFGVDRAESAFFDVIDLLREEPKLKDYFIEMVGKTYQRRDSWGTKKGSVPRELIELVAHEFRWRELKALAQAKLDGALDGRPALEFESIVNGIDDAFNEDWQDREFYKRYRFELGEA